jgi:hypothetical protein
MAAAVRQPSPAIDRFPALLATTGCGLHGEFERW